MPFGRALRRGKREVQIVFPSSDFPLPSFFPFLCKVKVTFHKYQGTGNDFIVMDNRDGKISLTPEKISKLCDRKFGIGADGVMLLQNKPGFDFEMIYYNSDGSQSLCGNGSRCITSFANQLGIIKDHAKFITTDGAHEADIINGWISLKMNEVKKIEDNGDHFFVNTGSPHYCRFVKDLQNYDVYGEGKSVRYSEKYKKEGTNVNFLEVISEHGKPVLFVRTYERGVENETLSCGTGVTAAALVAAFKKLSSSDSHCDVKTKGGDLRVRFENSEGTFTNIRLEGPAVFVFQGVIAI
jgi:diaminopimelate epimerase